MDNQEICVVSLIGKSQLQNQTKAWKLNNLIGKNYFQSDTNFLFKRNRDKENELSNQDVDESDSKADKRSSQDLDYESEYLKSSNHINENEENKIDEDFSIDSYFDHKNRTIYIHLESMFDMNNIFEAILKNNNETDSERKNLFELWEKELTKYAKAVLLLFSISHIIIISNPSCEFEIGYIRFFRIVDILRNKLLPSTVDLLKSIDCSISREWIYAGRPCSPRVLFAFENCPIEFLKSSQDLKNNKSIEKLQHSLEDQIYNCLRKSYVITNISNNSLFAIPANEEFVYIHRLSTNSIGGNNKFLLANLNFSSLALKQTKDDQNSNVNTILNNEELDAELFKKFVFEHTRKALSEGFNDNIGRTNVQPVFELPNASAFYKIFDALVGLYLKNESKSSKVQSHFSQIKLHLDIDAQFSENRCKKVFPTAIGIYQENLPNFYTHTTHIQRLEKAQSFYSSQARGPMFNHYLTQLKDECNNIWLNGRQLCEAVSLTGHNCVNELHKVSNSIDNNENSDIGNNDLKSSQSGSNELSISRRSRINGNSKVILNSRTASNLDLLARSSNKLIERNSSMSRRNDDSLSNSSSLNRNFKSVNNLPVKCHNSNIITLAASNCGELQRERKDPFDLKEANFTFYNDFSSPGLLTKTKNIINLNDYFLTNNNLTTTNNSNQSLNLNDSTQVTKEIPSSNQKANLNQTLLTSNQFTSQLQQQNENENQQQFISVNTDQDSHKSLSPVRNRSSGSGSGDRNNTIFNYMINSDSPLGSKVKFSSWSLVSIGKYADYNPSVGLTQPGFLSNHNFLIPWEMIIKNDKITTIYNDKTSAKKNAELSAAGTSVTLKAFFGMEYECPCGHRFICSGPDRLVRLGTNGLVKDDSYKLLNFEMPLYTACPCINSKESTPYLAQMMRVYVVTPQKTKAEVNNFSICLRPRVQPNPPPCPTFYPIMDAVPISLNENSFIVLRLPYIYMGDNGTVYYMPKNFETLNSCRILKGMFSSTLN